MILEALSATRDLGRLHEIVSVLIRNGLGDAVRRMGIAPALERAGRAVNWKGIQNLDKEPEVRLREALEALGPTFVKFGQILAGRIDLLPPEWTTELSLLHERAQEVPIEEIRAQLLEDLGQQPEAVFAHFEAKPLAAASIAQVHRATLEDGTEVILKIRRPGIRELVEADLRILKRIAEQVEERLPELRRYRPVSLVRQFGHSLRDELDLRLEAKNAERLQTNLRDLEGVQLPSIHRRWTRERLCVMDYLEGPSISEWLRAGKQPPIDGQAIAALGAQAVLRMVFADGCFHADPHPGNILLLPEGRLGVLDFGMVGYLSTARRQEFLSILIAVATRDVDMAVATLVQWSDEFVESGPLANDCSAFIDRYHGPALDELDTTELLLDLMALLRDNKLYLPEDVALLIKVFITLDSVTRSIDPEFVIASHVEPFAKQAWREQHSPTAVMRRGVKELSLLLTELPHDVRELAARAKRGQLQFQVDVEQLQQFGQKLDRSANRLTVGLVAAALIIGTAISFTVPGGPQVLGLPMFGFFGFASSIVVGLWLLWSIFRSGGR